MPETYGNPANTTTFRHPITGEELNIFLDNDRFVASPKFALYETQHATQNYKYWVLSSAQIFIGDTDDLELDWLSCVRQYPEYKFRIYRTYKGYRFFVLNKYFSFFERSGRKRTHFLFESFQCDKLYTNQCWYSSSFRARLTAKPGRYEPVITQLVYSNLLSEALPEIQMCVAVHDGVCLNHKFQQVYDLNDTSKQIERDLSF